MQESTDTTKGRATNALLLGCAAFRVVASIPFSPIPMKRLASIVGLLSLFLAFPAQAYNPHGTKFYEECNPYHNVVKTPYAPGSERDTRAQRKSLRFLCRYGPNRSPDALTTGNAVYAPVPRKKPAKTCDLVKPEGARRGSRYGVWSC